MSTKVWVSFRLFVFFAFLLSLLAIAPQAWASSTATSTTLAISSGGNSVTTVTSGSVVTLTAAVTAGTAKVATGQVNFCDAAAAHCTDIHILGIAQLTSAGTATFKFRPGFGSHSYKAVFLGTNTNAASSSGASPLAVTGKYPTTTMIVATGNPGDYTLTATVASTDKGAGAVAPSGSVSFLDTSFSNTMVGTASLSSGMTGLSFLNRGAQVLGNDTWLVATGDFNGDGIPDIVVGGQTVDGVTVFLGNGDGTFTQAPNSPIALSSGALALAVGDFNRDGKADLAVLVGGTVTIYLGNGDGTFTQAPGNPTAVGGSSASNDLEAVGDFNGDGMLDLAVANGDGGAGFVTILLGNGDGTFTQAVGNPVTVGTNPISIVVGDFNGDGIPDFATANFNYTGTVSVLLGKGDGTFTQAANSPITVGGFPYAISSADFNDDGKLDLAVANSAYTSNPPGTISILLGNGDGTFTQATGSPVAVGSTPHSASIGDFNGDGIPDIAAANEGSGTTTILLGNGNGTFTPAANTPPGLGNFLESIAVADFTGGGISDLVIGAQQGSATILLSALETATATANGVAPVGVGAHNVDASYAGDSNYSASVSATTSLTAGVAVPVISPASGTFASAQPITITDSTPGATIYYQTVYNQPSQWISGNPYVQYTGPIPMEGSGTLTINAYATATGYQQSENASATYAVNFPPAPTPVISLASGSYASAQSLTISDSAAGATIYYTTNGTYPSTDSTLYAGPITVSNSEIVTAIAIASGYSSSGYARAQYYIGSSSSRFIYTIGGSYTWGYSGDGGPATFAELAGLWGGVAVDGAGNVYTADSQDNVVRKIAAGTGIITTIAGTGVAGHTGDNGPASTAELWTPSSLAVDGKGNLFIAETGDNVVRRVDAGSGTITTFAGNPTGTGSLGGPATSYPLGSISGIACDITGNLYIGESNDLVEVNAGTGNITETEIVGRAIGSTGSVFGISGIAVDSRGNIYASDEGFSVVRKITPQGVVSIFAGSLYGASGGDGGPATSARLNMPAGVAVDGAGNVYIADNFDLTIRQVNTSGIINTIAGILNDQYSAGGDGSPATDVGLWYPQVIAADAAGNVYFADQATFKIRKITAPAAPPSTAAAAPVFSQAAGTYPGAQTLTMTDATPGAEIYVSLNGSAPTTNDQGYHSPIEITGSVTVQAIALAPGYLTSAPVSATYIITTPPTTLISTVAGNNKYGFLGAGGPATSASIGQPQAVTFDAAGNLYIADPANYLVWEVSASTGNIAIVAGTGTSGNGPNGGQATATELGQPYGVAIDKSGNLYIADRTNGRIRKVATQTGVITTIAGPGVSSTLGDGGPATSAYLGTLGGIAFDKAGNLYIADSNLIVGNAFTGRVRRIDANTGIITTVAGGGPLGQLGDGGLATSAYLLYPDDLTFDAAGNLYITDSNNERIRKVNASTGIITTIAGNGAIGGSGDGDGDGGLATAAKIGVGQGITVDSNGNVYFSDPQDRVRRVDAVTNIITTIAGDGYSGYGGDGGAATMAELYNPQGLAFDASGNLYIADESNCVVRKVTFPGPAAAPTFSLKAGTYSGAQTVTISDSIQGATIYYTTDGSTPTTASTKYSGSITVSTSETLQAIAVASGYTESAVASAQYTVTIPPTFTIAGAAVSIAPGAASGNTSAITITPAGGFTGAVTLTAVLASSPAGSVDAPTLSFGATSPVTITGASNGTATLTISTTAPTTKTCTSSTQMERRAPWYTGGAAALACVLLFGGRSQRKRWRSLLGMLLLLVALSSGVLACGGGGSKVVCTGTTSPGTTAGAYTITVTGTAGALTETGTVNLTVQ